MVGTVGLLFNLGQSIIQVPILLHFWSAETYGIWGILLASTGLMTSIDAGHQNYLGNKFCKEWIVSREVLRRDLASGVRMAMVLGGLELLVSMGILATGGLAWFGFESAHPGNAAITTALALYLFYWAVFGAVGGILVRMYLPAGLFVRGQLLGIVGRFAAFCSIVTAAACGASILGAMSAQVFVGTIFNLYLLRDLKRTFPELKGWWFGGNWATALQNFRASLVLTMNGFIEQAGNNGLVLFIGHILNPIAVALFTTLRTVANFALQGSSILLNPLTPDFVRFHLEEEGGKLTAVFRVSWLLGTTVVAGGLVLGVFVLEPLYAIWTRGALPLNKLLFALLGTAVAVRQWAAPLQTYLISLNRLRAQSAMAVTRALCGLGLAALLLKPFGLAAAGLGALAAEVGAATVAVMSVRAELGQFAAGLPPIPAALSLGQIAIAFAVWLLFAVTARGLAGAGAIALLLILALGCLQWVALPHAVRARLAVSLRRGKDGCPADA